MRRVLLLSFFLVVLAFPHGVHAALYANISADPATIASGGSTTITWGSAGECTGNGVGPDGTSPWVATPAVTTIYTINCFDTELGSANKSVTVYVGTPTVSFSATPTSITQAGGSSTLTWSSTNASSCTGTNFSTGAGSPTSGSTSVSPTLTTTYTVTCSGVAKSVTVYPVLTATGVSCSANPTSVGISQSVTWSSNVLNGTPPYTYSWIGDNLYGHTEQNPSVSYVSGGVKDATVTVTDSSSNPGSTGIWQSDSSYNDYAAPAGGSCTSLPSGPNTCNAANGFPSGPPSVGTSCNTNNGCIVSTPIPSACLVEITTYYCEGYTPESGPKTVTKQCSNTVTIVAPDLTAGAITPTTATGGVATTLSSTITNIGNSATGAGFTNLFQIDNDSNHNTSFATTTDTSPALAISGADVSQITYTFPAAGTYYVRACADSDASWATTITEGNELNNCGAWTAVTVSAPATQCSDGVDNDSDGLIDYVSGGGGGSAFTSRYSFTGNSFALTTEGTNVDGGSVTNTGGLPVFEAASYTYASDPVLRVAPRSGATSAATAVSQSSYYTFTVAPEAGKSITLSSLAFNAARGGASTPRGWVVRSSANGYSANLGSSDIATVRPTWTAYSVNLSSIAATTSTVTFRVYVYAPSTSNSVEFDDVTLTGTAAGAGDPDCTDANDTTESSTGQPNLSASVATPILATAGVATTFSSTITNGGTATTGAGFTNRFEFDDDTNHASGVATVTDASPTLTSSATDVSQVSFTFATSGTKYVRVCADTDGSGGGSIAESDETNNCTSWASVTVEQADLTAGSVTPTTATQNVAATLSATILNEGDAATGISFTNLFQIDADSDHDSGVTATRTDTSPALAVSGTDVSQVSYTFAAVGTWYVRACADNDASWNDSIDESDEGDNCGAWTTVVVSDANGCPLAGGHEDYCALCGPCGSGEGDCDAASECTATLICREVSGTDNCVLPRCNDGSDNDNDGLEDYPGDPGCVSLSDDDETTPMQCNDGQDNDGNEKEDYPDDPGCESAEDNNESIPDAVITLTANPDFIDTAETTTLSWSIVENAQSDSCYITGPGFNSGALSGTSGDVTTPVITKRTRFVLHCLNIDDKSVTVSKTIQVLGTIQEI